MLPAEVPCSNHQDFLCRFRALQHLAPQCGFKRVEAILVAKGSLPRWGRKATQNALINQAESLDMSIPVELASGGHIRGAHGGAEGWIPPEPFDSGDHSGAISRLDADTMERKVR